jgi:hypothetical protein
MGGPGDRRFLSAKGSYHPGSIEKSSNPDDLRNGAGPRRHQLTPFRFSVETIFRRRRKRSETKAAYLPISQITGIVMLALILNAIYRKFLTTALPGMVPQGAKR